MRLTMIAAAVFGACLSLPLATAVAEPIELQWWHAMTSVNADRVNKIAADFNASQTAYKIVPVFKGTYAETMNAGSRPTAPAMRRTSSRSSRSAPRP
jgi:sn-glycerol 3-phosphate transport system substrate-binding protein